MNQSDTSKRRRRTIKIILEVTFFVALMIFAVIYTLKDHPEKTFLLLGQASFFPLCVAILAILLTLVLDGCNITMLAHLYHPKYRFSQGLINVFVGQSLGVFVKTAASLVQAYTFTKQDIKSAQGASVLTMNYLMFQLSLVLYSTVMIFFGYPFIKDIPIPLFFGLPVWVLALIGYLIQLIFLFSIIGLGFWRGLHRLVLNSGINLFAKLHLLVDPEATRKRLTLQFATYRVEMKRLFHNKKLVAFLLVSNILKRIILGTIPFVIFWSLGTDMTQLGFWESLFGTGYVNVVSSFINVGIPEVLFQSIFSSFLQNVSNAANLASAANLLWRSITFYLLFVIGILSLAFYRGAPKRYVLLSNTATIYDFELANLQEDPENQKFVNDIHSQSQKPVLTQADIDESFRRIRESILNEKVIVREATDDDLKATLEKERIVLANIVQETEQLMSKDKPDEEIQKEARKEMEIQEQKTNLKQNQKEEKAAQKKAKQIEKEKKKLLSMKPQGEIISSEGNQLQETNFPSSPDTGHSQEGDLK